MMLQRIYIVLIFLGVVLMHSCFKEPDIQSSFLDDELISIREYVDSIEQFSSFKAIMEKGGLDIALSAYNPHGNGYTLFLPDNDAIERFREEHTQFTSLEDLLSDEEFAATFSRYHVLNMKIRSNDFPFGAFPSTTLTEDYLTVNFYAEEDTSYYKINNQSLVTRPNLEMSNGYIHYIQDALQPITFTTFEWLEQNSADNLIFIAALELTGLDSTLNFNADADESLPNYTLLMESDDVFNDAGISSITDLENFISPGQTNYADDDNPLYEFVAYHILKGNRFLADFEDVSTLYNTQANIPLSIDGTGIDLAINKGKQVFDTIIYLGDTTYIDYISVLYDESNILTQSGSIHMLDQVMTVKMPDRSAINYEFYNNKYIDDIKNEAGTYLLDESQSLDNLEWSAGIELYFYVSEENINAWGENYLMADGDIEISYEIDAQITGEYDVFIRADQFNSLNAIVEVYVDGEKISGLIDLTTGGNSNNPFQTIYAGTVNFVEYKRHIITVKTIIPGRLYWDAVRLEPK